MNSVEWLESIQQQVNELTEKYRGLHCVSSGLNLSASGKLTFSAQYNGVSVEDEYMVEITIPQGYPGILPSAKETGGRIPKDFHKHPDETLCLGSRIEMRIKFRERESLIGFVEDLLIPFLYGFSYREKYGEMPYGELPHGIEGVLKSYQTLFHVNDDLTAIAFLKILADQNYRGHMECPCGSGLKLRNCHGGVVKGLMNYQSAEEYLQESIYALCCMKQQGKIIPPALLPLTFIKRMRRHRNKRH